MLSLVFIHRYIFTETLNMDQDPSTMIPPADIVFVNYPFRILWKERRRQDDDASSEDDDTSSRWIQSAIDQAAYNGSRVIVVNSDQHHVYEYPADNVTA